MSIQTRNVGFADLLLGALSTDAGMVVGYFFGTSMSSHEKTKLLAGKAK